MGSDPLTSPPPTAGNPSVPGQPNASVFAGGAGGAGQNDAVQGMLQMSQQIDQGLTTLARMFPAASEEFDSARQLIQIGFAKALRTDPSQAGQQKGAQTQMPAASENNSGTQFPGGGNTSPGVDIR